MLDISGKFQTHINLNLRILVKLQQYISVFFEGLMFEEVTLLA